jgi:hypothetical protein
MRNAKATGIAGGAIAIALLDKLVERGILIPADCEAICATAQVGLSPYIGIGGEVAAEASRIVGELHKRFAKYGA